MTDVEINNRINEIDARIAEIDKLLANPELIKQPDAESIQIQKYEAAAESLMDYDPQTALQYMGKAEDIKKNRELMDWKKQVAEAEKLAAKDPEKARIRLMQILDNYIAMRNSAIQKDQPTATYDTAINAIQAGLRSDAPNIKDVFTAIQDFGAGVTAGTITQPSVTTAPTQAGISSYESRLSSIEGVKSLAELEDLRQSFAGTPIELNPQQKKEIELAVENKRKQLTPKAAPTIESVAKQVGAEPLKMGERRFSLFSAGINNMKNGVYGTAIQNFIKTANPGEAVMADDINQANKGTVTGTFSRLLDKFGIDATGMSVEQIARSLMPTAQNAISNQMESLRTYGLKPEEEQDFIKRYYNGATVLKYLENPSAFTTSKSTTPRKREPNPEYKRIGNLLFTRQKGTNEKWKQVVR